MRKQSHIELLASYLQQAQAKTFEWGVHDCATFAAGAIEVMTDLRIEFDDLRTVRTAEEVIIALRRQSLRDRVTLILGPPIHINLAGRGDIVLEADSDREALGVCFGEFAFFLSPTGLVPKPTISCVAAWRVE